MRCGILCEQVKRQKETDIEFASRVQKLIAQTAHLKAVEWDGYATAAASSAATTAPATSPAATATASAICSSTDRAVCVCEQLHEVLETQPKVHPQAAADICCLDHQPIERVSESKTHWEVPFCSRALIGRETERDREREEGEGESLSPACVSIVNSSH